MENNNGYSTKTYKFRLYSQHYQWLQQTKEIYNLVLKFYYEVLQKEPELLAGPKNKLMRELEILTVGVRGQDREDIKYPLPYEKIPLYFRRAAINDAARLMRSCLAGKEKGSRPAREFHACPIFYKGMYKDFTEEGICLKLWNGERWVFEECSLAFCKRVIQKDEKLLSPILKLDGKKAMLHVPVIKSVEDVRTVKERFPTAERICSAAFPGNDCMAVLTVLNKNGECIDSLFIRGGRQLAHEKQKFISRIRKNRKDMGYESGDDNIPKNENYQLKKKIRNLTDTAVHRVSCEAVNFCKKQGITILAVPNYKQSINMNALGYLNATSYDWLARRIIQYIRYKAFEKGIAVASVSTKNITANCYRCGQPVKRFNKQNKPGRNYYGGKNYICPNGHQGNTYFNTAMNVGRNFLKSQAEMQG